jgi:hypothetical protein
MAGLILGATLIPSEALAADVTGYVKRIHFTDSSYYWIELVDANGNRIYACPNLSGDWRFRLRWNVSESDDEQKLEIFSMALLSQVQTRVWFTDNGARCMVDSIEIERG